MPYLVLSHIGEEFFKQFLSPDPDPDNLKGGLGYDPSCVKKSSRFKQYLFELRTWKTNRPKMKFTTLDYYIL